MNLIANKLLRWFNGPVKNSGFNVKEKLISKYLGKDDGEKKLSSKSTDINILLNRVKTNQKNENRKKIYFSALASSGLILFGILIF